MVLLYLTCFRFVPLPRESLYHMPDFHLAPVTFWEKCNFKSQFQHHIDMELLHQIGGQVQFPPHSKNAKREKQEAWLSCGNHGCPCTAPTSVIGPDYTFVEIGAHDGVDNSNTYFAEKNLKWRGLCVEPNPHTYAKLQKNRPDCININGIVANEPGPFDFYSFQTDGWQAQMSGINTHFKTDQDAIDFAIRENIPPPEIIKVPAYRFSDLFRKHGFDRIDLFSLDVEGAELAVLETIDFSAVSIHYVIMEIANGPEDDACVKLLKDNSFYQVPSNRLLFDNTFDVWFENNNWVSHR